MTVRPAWAIILEQSCSKILTNQTAQNLKAVSFLFSPCGRDREDVSVSTVLPMPGPEVHTWKSTAHQEKSLKWGLNKLIQAKCLERSLAHRCSSYCYLCKYKLCFSSRRCWALWNSHPNKALVCLNMNCRRGVPTARIYREQTAPSSCGGGGGGWVDSESHSLSSRLSHWTAPCWQKFLSRVGCGGPSL